MPLNVRRFCTSIFLVLFGSIAVVSAQSPAPAQPALAKAPTSAEVMRDRISKAKAFIAVRNYSAAIFELESIRKETSDTSVHAVANVLLMNSYLEQGDYKRAQDFLTEFHTALKANKPNSSEYYSSIAGQAVKGARYQVERYRGLGLTVSDRNLPLQAVNDIEQMRETLELVVAQTKELSGDKVKGPAAMALLEEAATTRSILARDDYDARRWRDVLGDSRELLAQSRSVIINAVDAPGSTIAAMPQTVAVEKPAVPAAAPIVVEPAPEFKPVSANTTAKKAETTAAEEPARTRVVPNVPVAAVEVKKETPAVKPAPQQPAGPLDIGQLIAYATERPAAIYPATARSMRTTGIVRVDVMVNEDGEVIGVENTSGPALLKGAAQDAVKKWKFKPFVRDGQPVKAKGYVNFNFTL